jgi:hypothetical protein
MTTGPQASDRDDAETPKDSSGRAADGAGRGHDSDPRATSHPTGDKQAAENAENEPAG